MKLQIHEIFNLTFFHAQNKPKIQFFSSNRMKLQFHEIFNLTFFGVYRKFLVALLIHCLHLLSFSLLRLLLHLLQMDLSPSASEASKLLEAALEQMDGIIQGAKFEIPAKPASNPVSEALRNLHTCLLREDASASNLAWVALTFASS